MISRAVTLISLETILEQISPSAHLYVHVREGAHVWNNWLLFGSVHYCTFIESLSGNTLPVPLGVRVIPFTVLQTIYLQAPDNTVNLKDTTENVCSNSCKKYPY